MREYEVNAICDDGISFVLALTAESLIKATEEATVKLRLILKANVHFRIFSVEEVDG